MMERRKNKKTDNKRGSVLVISLVILSVILIAALSISFGSSRQRKLSSEENRSIIAYQLADAGVEAVMNEILQGEYTRVNEILEDKCTGKLIKSSISGMGSFEVVLKDNSGNQIDCNESDEITRIKSVKGIGRSGFVQRAAEAAVYYKNKSTLLLLHMDGNDKDVIFDDSSYYSRAVSPSGDAQTSQSEKKFTDLADSASGYLDGSGDYISSSSDEFDLKDGEFTIDFWVYLSAVDSKRRTFFSIADGSDQKNGISVGINGSNHWYYSVGDCDTYWSSEVPGTFSDQPETNTWTHVALVRSGDTLKLFIDGKNAGVDSISMDGGAVCFSNNNLYVGRKVAWDATGLDYYGYIDEFRVSKTARWTEDFTPEDSPYSAN